MTAPMNGTSPPELAALLRKSADVVERKEFHPLLFQTMRALTAYAGEYADGSIKSAAPPSAAASSAAASAVKEVQQPQQQPQPQKLRRRGSRDAPGSSEASKQDRGDPPGKKKSAFHDVPDAVLDSNGGNSQGGHRSSVSSAASAPLSSYAAAAGAAPSGAAAAAARVSAPGGQFASAAAAASSNNNKQESSPQQQHQTPSRGKTGVFNQESSQQQQPTPSSSRKGFSLKGIKTGIQKIGADILGDHDKNRDDVPFDEMAWCDEHFTRGCACKSRKNAANNNSSNDKQHSGVTASTSTDSISAGQQQQQQPAQAMRQSQTSSNTTSNAVTDPEKPAKPCFQRPINPSSNLIANGWIDQQRRSKMRVVWKDVLASLVEGRRPGEETTLWIQRQVINAQTGKVTGLEALHQIPMKWLEDVNYVDLYGDHRFTLKVYNIAEEFYFRTRDEQSAQSWVLTLRSARDASLEGNVRMLGSSTSSAQSAAMEKMKPSAKDMGLHNVDDWDQGKNNSHEGAAATSPPLAQAGSDGGADSHPSSSQPQQQQAQPAAASVRKPISELRAIAHGAGYNTRGMERQDLERIAASFQSGSYNPNPPASAPPTAASGSDNIRHSMQQEAAMKEAEQRAAIEKREKEQAQAKAAQMAQEDAMARRQHENEERAAVEKMRRERDAAEQKRIEEQMAAAEHQRRNQEFEQQAAEIKRKQEEDRHRKMAELQASERTRQQQQQHQAQAVAAAERNKREEEEQRRRQQQQAQQQAQQHHQQQQQAQRQGTIPSPPTSGQQQQQQWGQPQQQQQQHYQQWQQHQQQQHAHFQQQGFPGQQQQHPQQPFFNQNMPPQGAYQQQQHQQQQQHAHFQHQQQQKQQPQHPQPGANPQGANAANPDSKYAKQMEEKNDEEDQSAVTLQIKRSILINWALQPPNLNVLRPIDQLITSIHTAMPPAFGVATHAYFAKFTPIAPTELVVSAAMGNHPDETKLKKAVRKVRVFLHPDKLPRDLTTDQLFTARMLWDITSDSWEEFQKHKDELDWIRS